MLDVIETKTQLYPGQHLTLEEFEGLPKDGFKYELLEGVLIMTPAGLQHEEIGGNLHFAAVAVVVGLPVHSAGYLGRALVGHPHQPANL